MADDTEGREFNAQLVEMASKVIQEWEQNHPKIVSQIGQELVRKIDTIPYTEMLTLVSDFISTISTQNDGFSTSWHNLKSN